MIEIPPKVASLLDESVRRVRRIYLARGIAAALAAFLLTCLAVMGIDAWVTIYSDPLRLVMSLGIYVSSLGAFSFTALRPLSRKIDRLKMAKFFDARHEENEECLTTLVELFLEQERAGGSNASPAFVRLLSVQAEKSAAGIDVKKELTTRTVKRRLVALSLIASVFAASFMALPRLAGMLFLRAVAPLADVGNLYSGAVRVTPGDINVLAGEKIVIKAVVEKGFGYEPEIRISRRTALGWGTESAESMSGGVYRAMADIDDREWRYRVSAGPAVTRYFSVAVHEKPAFKSFSAKIDYPAYTGFPSLSVSNEALGSVRALEGSRVTFEVALDHRASKAQMLVAGRETMSWTMSSTNSAEWSLVMENDAGFRSPPLKGTLESVLDMPPSVVIEKPQNSVRVPPHAKVPFSVTALDDTPGLSNALLVRTPPGEWRELRTLENFSRVGASLWKGDDELDLSLIGLEGERRVEFAVLVRDACPADAGGPHCVTSAPVVVHLESKAESFVLQSLAAEEKKMKAKIEEAKKRLAAAMSPARSAAARIMREKKVSETADREIARSVHETREAQKRLDEIRERALPQPGLKPLEKKLNEVIAKNTSPILEKLKAAQFDSPEKRTQALGEVPQKLAEAVKAVQEFEKEFNGRMSRLKNHERMEDLSRRQEALARSALTGMKREDGETSDPRMMEAWRRMQLEAAAKARELARVNNDAGLEEVRREMEKAAALMAREKTIEEERAKRAKKEKALNNGAEAQKAAADKKTSSDAPSEPRSPAPGSAAEKAMQAARSMKERLAMEAKSLGLDVEPAEAASRRGQDASSISSGGIAAELKRRMLELKNVESAGDIKELLLREGWFRIKGSARDGLGGVDLDAVAPEYRELVRLYFLKLAEETKL